MSITPAQIIMGKKLLKKAIAYIDEDMNRHYELKETAFAVFTGTNIGRGSFDNGILCIDSAPGGDVIKMKARPFKAETKYWNGPDIIPDDLDDGSFEMSLWHDLVCEFKKEIAVEWKTTEDAVVEWANKILPTAWIGYGEKKETRPIALETRAKIGFNVVEAGRKWWNPWAAINKLLRKCKKVIPLILIAATLTGCTSCSAIPDWKMKEASPIVWEAKGVVKTNMVEVAR